MCILREHVLHETEWYRAGKATYVSAFPMGSVGAFLCIVENFHKFPIIRKRSIREVHSREKDFFAKAIKPGTRILQAR